MLLAMRTGGDHKEYTRGRQFDIAVLCVHLIEGHYSVTDVTKKGKVAMLLLGFARKCCF